MDELEIGPAQGDDFACAIDWAAAEGWNPGLDDLAAFRTADPDGLILGRLDGRPVGSISAVRYGERFGFLGFYIVIPQERGKGHGMALWTAAMDRFGDRIVGLDGVVDQQDNYRRSGFVPAGRNIRFTGPAPGSPPADDAAAVRPMEPDDLPAVLAYDRPFFADERTGFLTAWVQPRAGVARTCHVAARDGAISGYGVIRACRAGHKIGPLFADDARTAEALFLSLASTLRPGEQVSLDVPEANGEGTRLADRYGLSPSFETARMYRGPAPELPLPRTFGITTFELG